MEAVDVWCSYCEVDIGEECLNRDGGPLGYGSPRAVGKCHKDRHEVLAKTITLWESWPQGMRKAALRDESVQIELLTNMLAVPSVLVGPEKPRLERELRSRRNRYSALWNLLDPGNRPVVKQYVKPEKVDVPHPELIDCPKVGCGKKKGEKCLNKEGLQAYHIARVNASP